MVLNHIVSNNFTPTSPEGRYARCAIQRGVAIDRSDGLH